MSPSQCQPLRAGGAGGALQGGLGEAAGQGSDAGVGQGGGWEEFVPARDGAGEIQLLQDDLRHPHEALVVHAPVIAPHDHLRAREGAGDGNLCPEGKTCSVVRVGKV